MKISETTIPIRKAVFPFYDAAFIFLITGILVLWGIFNVFMPDTQTLVYFGVCGFIASLGSVLILSSRLRRGHSCLGLLVLNIGFLFWFWLEILILSVDEAPFRNLYAGSPIASTFPNHLVAEGFLLLTAFTGLSIVGWLIVSLSLAKFSYPFLGIHRGRIAKSHTEGRVDILLFTLSLCGWLPIISSSGGLQLAIQNMIGLRTAEIQLTAGFSSYLPIVAIVASGIALARLVEGSTRYNLFAIASILMGGFIAVSSGTRFKLIFLFLPALVCLFDMLKYRNGRRKTYLYFALCASLTLLISASQFAFRYASSFDVSDLDALSILAGSEHFSAALNAIHMMEFQDAFQQSMAMLFVTDLIPRFIWENKPIHEYWLFYNQISLGGNVTPSILGQYYMNWGVIGVLVSGLIFGLWAGLIDLLHKGYTESHRRQLLVVGGFLAAFLFLSFRHYSANYFFYVLVSIVILYIAGFFRRLRI